MLARQSRAAAQALEHSTFLPFLYHTPTITRPRRYATSTDDTRDGTDGWPRRRPRSDDDASAAIRGIDHVPFERSTKEGAEADIEGSTITPKERQAFKKLFKLRKHSVKGKSNLNPGKGSAVMSNDHATPDKPASTPAKLQNLDEIMDSVSNDDDADFGDLSTRFPQPLQRMAKEAHEQRKRDSQKPSQSDAIAAAAKKDLAFVGRQFSKAKTDVDLWNALQTHVFKRVIALNLDAPTPKKRSRRSKKASSSKDPETAPEADTSKHQQPTPAISDLDILTHTLPTHLTTYHHTLTTHFPASTSLPLTLLPSLKHLGPTAFALGASTRLFNAHMRACFRITGDLNPVVETLREMDSMVYEYDEYTEAFIRSVLVRGWCARAGVWGDGVKVVWEGEGMRKGIRGLEGMRAVVRGRREEVALRRAQQEVEEDGRVGAVGEGEDEGGGEKDGVCAGS